MNLENITLKLSPIATDELQQTADVFGVSRNELIRSVLPSKALQRVLIEQARLNGGLEVGAQPVISELIKRGLIAEMLESSHPIHPLDYEALEPDAVALKYLQWSEALCDALAVPCSNGAPAFFLAQYPAGGEWEQKGAAGRWRVLPKGQGFALTPDSIVQVVNGVAHDVSPYMV